MWREVSKNAKKKKKKVRSRMPHIQEEEERASKAGDGCAATAGKPLVGDGRMKRGDGGLRSPARRAIRDDDAAKPGAPLCFKTRVLALQLHRLPLDMHKAKGPSNNAE